MSFKKQLLAEHLLARGYEISVIKLTSLLPLPRTAVLLAVCWVCASWSGVRSGCIEMCVCVCVSLQQPSVQLRSFPWWKSRVWIVTLPLEVKWCS